MLLVTGGNGFIAKELVKFMLSQNINFRLAGRACDHEVIGVGDIHGDTDWSSALPGISAVVHLAGVAHRISTQPSIEEFRSVNVAGSINLAKQAARSGVGRFVFISSIGVLGQTTRPGEMLSDTSQTNPQSLYAVSKHEAEIALRSLCDDLGIELVILRPPLVYGLRAKGNYAKLIQLVSKGYPLPFGSFVNKRNLVSVESLAQGIIASATKPAAANQTFVIADKNPVSTPEVINAVAAGLGVRARLFSCPPAAIKLALTGLRRSAMADGLLGSLQIDSSRIASCLGWCPEEDTKRAITEQFPPFIRARSSG